MKDFNRRTHTIFRERLLNLVRTAESIAENESDNRGIVDLKRRIYQFRDRALHHATFHSGDQLIPQLQNLEREWRLRISGDSGFFKAKPIGLQIATVNEGIPVYLNWDHHFPEGQYLIEIADFLENTLPLWRLYTKTESPELSIRDLKPDHTYWFRISVLTPA